VSALQGTLNTTGGSRAKNIPPHEPSAERPLMPTSRGKDDERALVPTALICIFRTFGGKPPNVLSLSRHVPTRARGATHRVAPDEPRKRRADQRHVVGCCEELGGDPVAIFDFKTLQRWRSRRCRDIRLAFSLTP
jgi:hypothetical protein